ncbi:MAG: YceI family protein [bacterium]
MTKKLLGLSLLLILVVLVTTGFGCSKKDKVEEEVNTQPEVTVPVSANYVVNIDQTVISWAGEMILVGKKHTGEIKVKSGSLATTDGQITSGEVIMDMTTIADKDLEAAGKAQDKTKLEDHLKSADFFDVENYPEAKFVIISVAPVVDGTVNQYNVTADLTIKDRTNSVNFPAIITVADNQLTANGELTIDRTLWDIRWGSDKFFDDLGDKVLNDEIKFTINLKADVQPAAVTTTEETTENPETANVEENENVEVE